MTKREKKESESLLDKSKTSDKHEKQESKMFIMQRTFNSSYSDF